MSAGTVYTFCRYCSAACGIEVTVEGNRVAKISADKANPAQLATAEKSTAAG